MNLPCNRAINCPGSDFPILNVSSEGVDRLLFSTIYYPPNPVPCLVNCNPDTLYSAQDCHGVVYSATSQLEADLLALAASINCGTPTPAGACFNDAQTASFTCPDGTVFSYTVPAGTVSATNNGDEAACIAAANAQALAMAQQQLATFTQDCPALPPSVECVISSTSPLPNARVGTAYSHTMVGTTSFGADTWSISSGTLPPGLVLLPAGVIQGTPTTAGTYNFTIQLQGS